MRLKKLDKIRLVVMLPLSLAFIVVGSIALSSVDKDQQTDLSSQLGNNFLNTETEDVGAQVPTLQSTSILVPSSIPVVSPVTSPAVSPEGSPVNSRQFTSMTSSQAESEQEPSDTDPACEPMKEYCNPPGANLLDDVLFNQSHDGSFENPICTLQPNGDIDGKGCEAVGNQATHYQADTSALIPINSQAFFSETGNYQRPEYIRQEVVGGQQCQEKLTAHGFNSFKIFSRGGHGLKGGLCLPMKNAGSSKAAGINFRVSQQTDNISDNVPVTFKLGYITFAPQNNTYFGTSPSLSEASINWIDSEVITSSDYAGDSADNGYAARYGGGFLEGQLPPNAQGFCFMAESSGGNGINTFWDAAFASTDTNACENALDHSDGVDRSCGGYACGNIDPTYSGNYYTDFDQDYYAFDMPPHWNAKQCHYESISNGADSPYGTLFVGLDVNSCDINYKDPSQQNLHPEWDKPDVKCVDNRNWTYGYAWIGGIKDFGLLQYLDCAMGTLEDANFKGTESNPFFCSQILKAYTNTSGIIPEDNNDPAFRIRYSNTYSGLASATQAEGGGHFWKVPLLGSAVGTGVINFRQIDQLRIDPFLIGMRNSGSGLNNMLKYSMGDLADYIISLYIRTEAHQYEDSIVTKNEVLVSDLLAKGPVCSDIQGDPITKIHYGPENGPSDRAVFGFADDEGSSEHIIHAENIEITPEELCNLQFRENRVVDAECIFYSPGSGVNRITFTEDNINNSLSSEGYVQEITPTLPPPVPSGTPDEGNRYCESINLCGADFDCDKTMRDVYDQCIGTRQVDEIAGNPFIRQELPNGWKDLRLHGLNKIMESTWYNEFIQYNQPIRHENVGIDVNQVVSIYDQQQPKCTALSEDRRPVYCDDDPEINKAQQICRRVSPYDCGCNASNFDTCLLNCPALFQKPDNINTIGLDIEGEPLPNPVDGTKAVDTSIRAILNNNYPSFLEQFVEILEPKTYEGEGAQNYEEGQIYNYNPRYTGGFLLANTGSGTTQCTTDNSPGSGTGASQVRMENYFAYVGQVPRMNERIGFAATNNKDPQTVDQLTLDLSVDPDTKQLRDFFDSGGFAHDHIALPYCDLLSEEDKNNCNSSTEESCDCLIRSCQQQESDKNFVVGKYLPLLCQNLKKEAETSEQCQAAPYLCLWGQLGGTQGACEQTLMNNYRVKNEIERERCEETPKTNLDFNCDPMASYLMSQGFDSPELRFAACDDALDVGQCSYDKYGVHLITGPVQTENYVRAESLGLKWKMEVIVSDTEEMVNAMVESVNSFDGKTVFRFCNADQDINESVRGQDQSCDFRTEITGSSSASGEKVANMIIKVAERTTKPFLVSPVNEPVSEHWAGGDPMDPDNTTTMAEVSEFYTAFAEVLNSNMALRSKIEIGGPTYNVTVFGNYNNFERFHSEFTAKDVVDYWTVNIYNNNDLPTEISDLYTQYIRVRQVFNDSKLIAINETGDFQHDMTRLKESLRKISSESRVKYALFFNAFGGWGSTRGEPLILTDTEIRGVISSNRTCTQDDQICYIDDGGGTITPNPKPFGRNFTMVYDQLLPPQTSGGRTCSELPPAAGEYYEPDDVGMQCDGPEIRRQLPEYDFYRGALKRCGIPLEQTLWTEANTYGKGGDIGQIKQELLSKNITYGGKKLNDAEEWKLERLLTRSKEENTNPMIVISVWATESVFGLYGNKNEFNCGSAKDFDSSLDCILEVAYLRNTPLDEFVDIYGPFCHNETYATGVGEGGVDLICEDPDDTNNGGGTNPSCLVSPQDEGFVVTQCYGNTLEVDASNSHCLDSFPGVGLYGHSYEVLGSFHGGIDLVHSNQKIYSAGKGIVHTTGVHTDYGNHVIVEHTLDNSAEVFYTRYSHMDSILVTEGQQVDHNTQVGVMGNTGNAGRAHLHFELLHFPKKVDDVKTSLSTVTDPTDILLRDRATASENCIMPPEGVTEVSSENGITQYELDGLIILKLDKNQYTPSIEWDANAKTLPTWANNSSAQVLINGSLYAGTSPLTSSGRSKIRGDIIQPTMSSTFAGSTGQGYLAFNTNDMLISESRTLNLNSHQNILESVPIMILDGRKYTSNTDIKRRNTSFGYDKSGNYIIVIAPVEGKHSYSKIAELVLASGLGVNSLLNFDGGTSTGLIVRNGSMNINATTSRAVPGIMTFTKK